MCHTKLGRKVTRVFLRRLLFAGASRSPYHFFTREQQRARFISRTTRRHNERFTAPVPRLEYCLPANNCDVETYVITTPGLTSALALIKLSWPRSLFCEAITVPNKRRGCDCSGTPFRQNREIDKHAATHRTPPLSSSTVTRSRHMFDKFDVTRLRIWALHLHTTVVRTLATPHLHCDFTSWEDALGLHTETPHIARVWELNGSAAYARTTNPPAKGCRDGRRDLPEMSTSSSCQLD